MLIAVVVTFVAVGLIAFGNFVATVKPQPRIQGERVTDLVELIAQTGPACRSTSGADVKSGEGGLLIAGDHRAYNFIECRFASGEAVSIMTFDPDDESGKPNDPPCPRAEGVGRFGETWWIHQRSQLEGSGGMPDAPDQPDTALLEDLARRLGGNYVACEGG